MRIDLGSVLEKIGSRAYTFYEKPDTAQNKISGSTILFTELLTDIVVHRNSCV